MKVINGHNYDFINFVEMSHQQKALVLEWRNHESVRKWMYNTSEISEQNHLKFVETLSDVDHKLYFLVVRDSVPLGVFSIIDFDGKSGEWGYYLAPDFHHKNLGVEFYFASLSYCFEMILLDTIVGYALKSNRPANSLNSLFGFESGDAEKVENMNSYHKVILTKEKWIIRKNDSKISKLLKLTA